MKFYAIILPTETDMDFSFYKSEGGPALDDGEEIFAEGDTAEEAWANLMKAYKVGAHGRTSYLHPDQLGESYHHVHFMHRMITQDIPEALKEKGHIPCGSNRLEMMEEDGCFTTTLLGNWEVNISITHEPPATKIAEPAGDITIDHGPYKIILSKDNHNIAIQYKGGDIVWVDNYNMGKTPEECGLGGESVADKPMVVVTPCKGDDAAVVMSIEEEKVLVNDIDWNVAVDNRNKEIK